MWKRSLFVKPILAQQNVRFINNMEIAPRYKIRPKVGWFRRRGTRLLYPTSSPRDLRQVGVDLNLQERLSQMFAKEQNEAMSKRVNIGFVQEQVQKARFKDRKEYFAWKKQHKQNKELERAARKSMLEINLEEVKAEHEKSGNLFKEVEQAAELYGIFDDLFDGSYFTPNINLSVEYDFDEELVTPVYRGNVIKPKESQTEPQIFFDDSDSLWTLVMTNPDSHFSDPQAEYLHWMVSNINGNDIKSGETLAPYLQPFPAFGTGFQRFIFVLYKQKSKIDLSKFAQPSEVNLDQRTFKTWEFYQENKDNLTPAGLAFFQSDWDSSLHDFFHNVLNMREPKFEYDFAPPYTTPWKSRDPLQTTPFNLFLDTKREPKEIQEEVLKKKLKLTHPLQGQLDKDLEFPNAHRPRPKLWLDLLKIPSWRLREIERERLRQGIYADMDWTSLRRDPSVS